MKLLYRLLIVALFFMLPIYTILVSLLFIIYGSCYTLSLLFVYLLTGKTYSISDIFTKMMDAYVGIMSYCKERGE